MGKKLLICPVKTQTLVRFPLAVVRVDTKNTPFPGPC